MSCSRRIYPFFIRTWPISTVRNKPKLLSNIDHFPCHPVDDEVLPRNKRRIRRGISLVKHRKVKNLSGFQWNLKVDVFLQETAKWRGVNLFRPVLTGRPGSQNVHRPCRKKCNHEQGDDRLQHHQDLCPSRQDRNIRRGEGCGGIEGQKKVIHKIW